MSALSSSLQQQQQQSPHSKHHAKGLLSRLLGSMHKRPRNSSSASSRSGAGSAYVSSWTANGAPLVPMVPQAYAGVSPSVAPSDCSEIPYFGYQVGLEEKYKYDRELGKGGNGIVRVVMDRETGEEFACKSIKKVLTDASDKKKQGHLDR